MYKSVSEEVLGTPALEEFSEGVFWVDTKACRVGSVKTGDEGDQIRVGADRNVVSRRNGTEQLAVDEVGELVLSYLGFLLMCTVSSPIVVIKRSMVRRQMDISIGVPQVRLWSTNGSGSMPAGVAK